MMNLSDRAALLRQAAEAMDELKKLCQDAGGHGHTVICCERMAEACREAEERDKILMELTNALTMALSNALIAKDNADREACRAAAEALIDALTDAEAVALAAEDADREALRESTSEALADAMAVALTAKDDADWKASLDAWTAARMGALADVPSYDKEARRKLEEALAEQLAEQLAPAAPLFEAQAAEDIQKAKAARAAYMRQWRARNRERVKAINDAYWLRRAAKENDADGEVGTT